MLTPDDQRWLFDVLAADTVSPLEGGDGRGYVAATNLVEAGAVGRGFRVVDRVHPRLDELSDPLVPEAVRTLAAADPDLLTERQPSLVLAVGRTDDPARMIAIDFHLDTVGPHVPPTLDGYVLRGRGTVDDKGPGIAALVGVARAFAERPQLRDEVGVVVLCVPAEEGGALGTFGTRLVLRRTGLRAALMVFAEPTGGEVLDAASAVMTPVIAVHGEDSTDDHPYAGTNATLALSHAALILTSRLAPVAERVGAKLCVAGISTGTSHNRVYGRGELRLNIAYYDDEARDQLDRTLAETVAGLGADFRRSYGDVPPAREIGRRHEELVSLRWLKRGYPALLNRHPALEAVLDQAGLHRRDGVADGTACTCDAIWGPGHADYVVVCGPGDLDRNGAHTDGEWVDVRDLDTYAERMYDLVQRFAAHVRASSTTLHYQKETR
ncbi:hypothetical protein GCM10023113_21510 [Cellulomonas oligotrophica]|uniref:Peptidase M20 n=1 Tax=Cellulomonas oligotrophica TaxID=931536 RepID=A0ABQ4DEG3_9CELL|nr:hypothetical protein Col01nite_32730 [Cellulomonas oligotrophica]